jgi:hypothetical protein
MPEHMVHGSPDAGGGYTMTSFLSWLMSPQDYMPHGMCFLWQPELIALHVASDSLIALAYYLIPIALIYFVSASACGHLPDRDSRADGEHCRDRFDAAVEPIVRIPQGPHTHDMRGAAGKNKEP